MSSTWLSKSLIQSIHEASRKKYLVDSFAYAQQDGNDVTKLVEYVDRYEIHILKESHGTYTLMEKLPVETKEAGFAWIKNHGYTDVHVVKMVYTDYPYNGGIVGLYMINDHLFSIILDFPKNQLDQMASLFGLNQAQVISIPYNKHLVHIGRTQSLLLV